MFSMSEIKRLTDEPEKKGVEIRGGNPTPKREDPRGVQIVGGSDAGTAGPLKILDRTSPVEKTEAEVHIHADRASYKNATEKDQ